MHWGMVAAAVASPQRREGEGQTFRLRLRSTGTSEQREKLVGVAAWGQWRCGGRPQGRTGCTEESVEGQIEEHRSPRWVVSQGTFLRQRRRVGHLGMREEGLLGDPVTCRPSWEGERKEQV